MSKYTPEACARAGIPYCQQKEREWYMRIADAYDEDCYLAEPATARFSRSYTRMAQKDGGVEGWQKHPNKLATIAEWRNHWRSLPDYDGPPMLAPSGTDYHRVFRADGSSRVSIPLRAEAPSFVGNAQLAALFGEVEEYCGPRDWGGPHIAPCPFRGWCPKLAGVET